MSEHRASIYNPYDWFWIVDGDETRYWSSAAGAYVTELPEDAGVTRIDTEDNLHDVLKNYSLPGPKVTKQDVYDERDRRLALGFDYDFGDARGVHHFAMTPEANAVWADVTTAAQAAINGGDGSHLMTIATDTGVVDLSADEWQQVLLAQAAFIQPIRAASYEIEQMMPIPLDYRSDSYWI